MIEDKRLELIGSGTVDMLKPLLLNFNVERGEYLHAHDFSISGSTYQFFSFEMSDGDIRSSFGTVETQQLPGDRVLITFRYHGWSWHGSPDEPEPPQEVYDRYDRFVNAFIVRLVQLGFVALPESQPPQIKPFGLNKSDQD